MSFGFYLAFKYDYILELSIAITVSTLIVTVPLFVINHMAKQEALEEEEDTQPDLLPNIKDGLVKASIDWSQSELKIWNHSRTFTREKLKDGVDWDNLHLAGTRSLTLWLSNSGRRL